MKALAPTPRRPNGLRKQMSWARSSSRQVFAHDARGFFVRFSVDHGIKPTAAALQTQAMSKADKNFRDTDKNRADAKTARIKPFAKRHQHEDADTKANRHIQNRDVSLHIDAMFVSAECAKSSIAAGFENSHSLLV